MNWGIYSVSTGDISAAASWTYTVTHPCAYSTTNYAVNQHCNGGSVTCFYNSVTTTSCVLGYNNKNNSNSTSFSKLNYSTIGY